MLKKLLQTSQAKALQTKYPNTPEPLDEGLFGAPRLNFKACTSCGACVNACPTTALKSRHTQEALTLRADGVPVPAATKITLNTANCVFCGRCQDACEKGAISQERTFEIATLSRKSLQQSGFLRFTEEQLTKKPGDDATLEPIIERVNLAIFGLFRRSLKLFTANAGSCGGCEEELEAALGDFYQGTQLGIEHVTEPLAADAIFVTGPITRPLLGALQAAYHKASSPKVVIAAGACACDGNVFRGSYAVASAADRALPVDVYLPGCPPTPRAILHGLLLLMERAQEKLTPTKYLADTLPQHLIQSLNVEAPTRPMPRPTTKEDDEPRPQQEAAPIQHNTTQPTFNTQQTTTPETPVIAPPTPLTQPITPAQQTQEPAPLAIPLLSTTFTTTPPPNDTIQIPQPPENDPGLPEHTSRGKIRAAVPFDPENQE